MRAFYFGYQDFNHPAVLMTLLKADPIQALIQLPGAFLKNIWISSFRSLGKTFCFSYPGWVSGARLPCILCPGSHIDRPCVLIRILLTKTTGPVLKTGLEPGVLGLVCLALAGIPFLVTGLVPDLWTFSSRFNLPFMLGACLVLVTIYLFHPVEIMDAGFDLQHLYRFLHRAAICDFQPVQAGLVFTKQVLPAADLADPPAGAGHTDCCQ